MIDETELGPDISEACYTECKQEEDGSNSFQQPTPMTHEQVMAIWKITESKLKLLISLHDLPVYNRLYKNRTAVDFRGLQLMGIFDLTSLYFMSDDIEKFEREHPELISKKRTKDNGKEGKLRNMQRHKERCRALAAYFWSQDDETTIADMIQYDPILKFGCEGKDYEPKTLRGWIQDLCPKPKPGRPRKD